MCAKSLLWHNSTTLELRWGWWCLCFLIIGHERYMRRSQALLWVEYTWQSAVVPEHRAWSFVAIMVVYCVEVDVVEQLGQPDLGLVTNKGAIGKSSNGGGCSPVTFSSSIVSRAEVWSFVKRRVYVNNKLCSIITWINILYTYLPPITRMSTLVGSFKRVDILLSTINER